ncbi:hypothetical protein WN943_019742 [Citrus x changshan-huyou]
MMQDCELREFFSSNRRTTPLERSSRSDKIRLVILEQYGLKKLWQDIKDICFDRPIKHVENIKGNPWIYKYFQC